MTTAIKIENVSKLYRLGTVGTGTISHDLNRWWHRIRGKEDPYEKVGQVNDRTQSSTKNQEPGTKNGSAPDYVWALRDINLEVRQGEILGIIGRNGAGKSTLLKLLSRVTAPTTGSIKTKGRIASLLEVGTGFHPDLTGRENIYMNGAILGMRRHEITSCLDEIIEFSGCARYLDTPVKRYSSGMAVRLGFAVAASLQTDILIVDEVLAVGDVEFQKKCLGKMSEVSASEGRTVLFVSHNMGSLSQLCRNGLLLENGAFRAQDRMETVIETYLALGNDSQASEYVNPEIRSDSIASISRMRIKNSSGLTVDSITTNERIIVEVHFLVNTYRNGLELALSLQDKYGSRIFTIHEPLPDSKSLANSTRLVTLELPDNLITPGKYSWIVAIHIPGSELVDVHHGVCHFSVVDGGTKFYRYHGDGYSYGYVFVNDYSVIFE